MSASFRVVLDMPEGRRTIDCADDEFIWNAAARAGIALPAVCHQGQCLTCAAKLLRGEFDQSAAAAYFPQDRDAGFVLPCTARPLSDVALRTHQEWEMRWHRKEHGLPAPYG